MAKDTADVCKSMGFKSVLLITENVKNTDKYQSVHENDVNKLIKSNFKFVIGIAKPKTRKKIAQKFRKLEYTNIIHPSSTILGNTEKALAPSGTIIFPGVRIAGRVKIKKHCILSLNCTVGHDCSIGNFVSIMPGATVSGNVSLASRAIVGSNASVLQGSSNSEKLKVGSGATIGMGSAVMRNVEADQTVLGVPASEVGV